MALTDKLKNIGDAIRSKNGTTAMLTLDQMATAISGIETDSLGTAPSYVKTEANRVISAVNAKKDSNSFVILAVSDSHQLTGNGNITNGNLHASQGAKLVANGINPDVCTHLGDYTNGNSSTTTHDGIAEIKSVSDQMHEAFKNRKMFMLIGNHDGLGYSSAINGGSLSNGMLQGLVDGNPTDITYGSKDSGYFYCDFTSKKIRVIVLNTADGGSEKVSNEQIIWFMNAMDLSSKSDAASWGIIVLSHHPLDWGSVYQLSNVVSAYMTSSSYTIGSTTKNYAGKNSAKFIANIHGHTHCYKYDNLYKIASGSGTKISNTMRVATPNACFNRNNEYGNNGTADYYGIEFGDTATYNKTANSASDTAFCVYIINMSQKKIEAVHYGAGTDRSISFNGSPSSAPVSRKITNSLTQVTTNNSNTSVSDGVSYSATLSPSSGYEITSVKVTMNGTDITSSAYASGKITISKVTGDIVITAIATKQPVSSYTNLLDTVGFFNGKYASEPVGQYGSDASYWATGVIEWDVSKPLYIKGWNPANASHSRFYASATKNGSPDASYGYNSAIGNTGGVFYSRFAVTTLGTEYVKIEAQSAVTSRTSKVYFTMSLPGTGNGKIITINQPIE